MYPYFSTQNIEEIKIDADAFCRRLRLAGFFLDNETYDKSIVITKANLHHRKAGTKI
jgi:hypothetical protein